MFETALIAREKGVLPRRQRDRRRARVDDVARRVELHRGDLGAALVRDMFPTDGATPSRD
jgi:hypothetical protein